MVQLKVDKSTDESILEGVTTLGPGNEAKPYIPSMATAVELYYPGEPEKAPRFTSVVHLKKISERRWRRVMGKCQEG